MSQGRFGEPSLAHSRNCRVDKRSLSFAEIIDLERGFAGFHVGNQLLSEILAHFKVRGACQMYGIDEEFAPRLKVFQRVLFEIDHGQLFALRISPQFFIEALRLTCVEYGLDIDTILE